MTYMAAFKECLQVKEKNVQHIGCLDTAKPISSLWAPLWYKQFTWSQGN